MVVRGKVCSPTEARACAAACSVKGQAVASATRLLEWIGHDTNVNAHSLPGLCHGCDHQAWGEGAS